nr:hypothetical protein [Phytoactinopolyspora alkaliphila]
MIDLAPARWMMASGHDAFLITQQDEVDQILGWCVTGSPVVQSVPADRIGQNPAPHSGRGQMTRGLRVDRAMTFEVRRVLVQSEPG